MYKRILVSCVAALLVSMCASVVHAQTPVRVGGYDFPPFVERDGKQYSGMTIDLINALNAYQDDYEFEFVSTTPKRRYDDFANKKYDMIMFEDINWGWADKGVIASEVFLKGGEAYIAKKDGDRGDEYFDTLDGKSISVLRGYHYGFADFNADEKVLKEKYNAECSNNAEGIIVKVAKGRTDIGVVTLSFLNRYLKEHPEISEELIVSDGFDQEYNHTILVREGTVPDAKQMYELLKSMSEAGKLADIWNMYGIDSNYIVVEQE